MSAGKARVAFDQVERKQQFEREYPDVAIEHRAAPIWHWAAFGAAQHRLLLGHLPLTDRFVRDVVEVIMAGIQGPARS